MQNLPLQDAPASCRLSAVELAGQYERGQLTPLEVTRAALERAHQVHERFNAFAHFDDENSLAAAEASTRRWQAKQPLSPLDGVPATIKDIVWVRGWPITFGTSALPVLQCKEDAPSVARMRAAGLVLLGATTTPEFGWKALTDSPTFGITRNPIDPRLTSGGSSGGAAVAAATGVAPLNLGTDGGGSIRIPAAFCGIVGMKPTYGRVAAYPASAFGTLSHIGPITRTAADAHAMLTILSGRDIRDWAQGPACLPSLEQVAESLKDPPVGFWSTPVSGAVDPAVARMVDAAVERIEGSTGIDVASVRLPENGTRELFECLWFTGAANRIKALDSASRARCDPGLIEVDEAAQAITGRELAAAHEQRAQFGARMDELLTRFRVLISPATAIAPFEAGRETPAGSGMSRWTEWAGFSYPVNLSQQPACVIPCGVLKDGRPVGLQIIGARGADAHVLQVAGTLEALLR